MIGHNPGICDMAQRLLDHPLDHPRMDDYPTGATLVADFNAAQWGDIVWGQGRAVDFVIPRELTG
jgi:phosphohistidine phosphatase